MTFSCWQRQWSIPAGWRACLEEDGQARDAMQPWDEVPSQAGVYVICKVQRYPRSLVLAVDLQQGDTPQ